MNITRNKALTPNENKLTYLLCIFQMSRWIQLLVLGTAIGAAKAANFVRLVILAGLGLAGLWMVHTLAQDFNHIMQSGFGSGGGGDHNTGKLFSGTLFNRNLVRGRKYRKKL